MLRKNGKKVWCAMLGMLLLIGMGASVQASEIDSSAAMTLQQTMKDTEIKEEPDSGAETLSELEKGTAVIVYGEPQDSWSQVEYQGVKGYIESNVLESYSAIEDADELDEEFEAVEEETRRIIDEHELAQKSKRKAIVWGIIIAILIVGIFAVGIISALKKDKEGEQE